MWQPAFVAEEIGHEKKIITVKELLAGRWCLPDTGDPQPR